MARYDLSGARATGILDDLASFAAELCAAPVSVVSLVEEDFQTFIARVGTPLEGTPRSQSFCAYAMHGLSIMEVPDATLDPRFAQNPLVTGDPNIRFYAGAPLVSREGVPLGAICVIDNQPRAGLTPFQTRGLEILATAVMSRLDARRTARESRETEEENRAALAESELRFHTLADTMPQMVWSALADGYNDYHNARWYEFTGVPHGATNGSAWNTVFHPDDRERAMEKWQHCLRTGEPYQIEYRMRHHDGVYRWVLGRALPIRAEDGRIIRWFGTCTDIHEQKLAIDEREIISQELSHRIKNIFAVMGGLIQFAARAHPDIAPLAADLRHRIAALGRAHDFVRPHSANSRPSMQQDSLRGLLSELLAPYQGLPGERVSFTGDDVAVDDRAATPLGLLFHELATNASKYGALSTHDGHVAIHVDAGPAMSSIHWKETGGPPATEPKGPAGFGTQLIELSAVRQLGGTVTREWLPEGLTVTIEAPTVAFSRVTLPE